MVGTLVGGVGVQHHSLHTCAISIDGYSIINKLYSFIFFSLLINAVILLLNCLVLVLYLYIHFLSLRCYLNLFSLLKHYLDLYISDTAQKVFRSLYCFTTSICHGVENYFPRLWGTGISNAIFLIIGLLNIDT